MRTFSNQMRTSKFSLWNLLLLWKYSRIPRRRPSRKIPTRSSWWWRRVLRLEKDLAMELARTIPRNPVMQSSPWWRCSSVS